MFRQYKRGSNETPLHAVANIVGGQAAVARIVGLYWGRMAFADIGHKAYSQAFAESKARLKFDHLESSGSGTYRSKGDKAPRYMGANIIPLNASGGPISISVKADGDFTAVVGVNTGGKVDYTLLEEGSGQVSAPAGAEVKLVVANTPKQLLAYDGFQVKSGPVAKGLKYTVSLMGATA